MVRSMKKRIIEFTPSSSEIEGVFDQPLPAAKFLPEWYKSQTGYVSGKKEILEDGSYNHTVKQCMPAFDAMAAGYIIPLPQDLEVVDDEDKYSIRWPSDAFKQISSHSLEQISEFPLDSKTWEVTAWKFHNPWIIKTPPGYSCLFLSPLWHEDLPFKCFPGVVDTDTYNTQPVNFPFLLRSGFRGKIEMGTPMIQVIPFRREAWKSKTEEESTFDPRQWEKSKRRFGHRYKKDYRQRKDYK